MSQTLKTPYPQVIGWVLWGPAYTVGGLNAVSERLFI